MLSEPRELAVELVRRYADVGVLAVSGELSHRSAGLVTGWCRRRWLIPPRPGRHVRAATHIAARGAGVRVDPGRHGRLAGRAPGDVRRRRPGPGQVADRAAGV